MSIVNCELRNWFLYREFILSKRERGIAVFVIPKLFWLFFIIMCPPDHFLKINVSVISCETNSFAASEF